MAEDMEIFLEQVIKKTNPEEYIKILEQDREDFAEEINRLNNIINRIIKYVESLSSSGRGCDIYEDIKKEILNKLKGDNK